MCVRVTASVTPKIKHVSVMMDFRVPIVRLRYVNLVAKTECVSLERVCVHHTGRGRIVRSVWTVSRVKTVWRDHVLEEMSLVLDGVRVHRMEFVNVRVHGSVQIVEREF